MNKGENKMAKLHENIKKYRIDNNLTQQEVAEQLYVTRQCISRWESGKTLPDIHSLEKLSSIYRCSIEDLITTSEVTEIALNEAIKNSKSRRVILSSIFISILAIVLSIFGILLTQQGNTQAINTQDTQSVKGILSEKIHDDLFVFSYYEHDNKESMKSVELILNHYLNVEFGNGIEANAKFYLYDVLEISFYEKLDPNHIKKIVIHERLDDEMIKGFIATPFKDKYTSIESIKKSSDQDKIYFFFEPNHVSYNYSAGSITRKETFSAHHPSKVNFEIVFKILLDPTKMTHDIYIGKVYEDKIIYTGTVNLKSTSANMHGFNGIIGNRNDDLFYNSYLTQFDLVHGPISTFNELTIYEYNQHNELIHTSSIFENSKLYFKAHKDAVYAIIKENFNKFDYLANPIPSFKSKVVYLGDSYELTRHIGFGFTEKTYFYYNG